MHAIGDGVDLIAWKHIHGCGPMPFGNAIDVIGEIESQTGHIQPVGSCQLFQDFYINKVAQQISNQRIIEFVMSCLDRSMGGEDAKILDCFCIHPISLQQLQGQQARLSFIHMIFSDLSAQGL